MLEIFVIGYCLYFLFNIYTSFMQIGYVKNAKNILKGAKTLLTFKNVLLY